MSKPNVMKALNNPMGKKKKPDEVPATVQKIQTKDSLQLKEKRKEMEMRLAYGTSDHSP